MSNDGEGVGAGAVEVDDGDAQIEEQQAADDIGSSSSDHEGQPLTQDDLVRRQLLDQLVNADSFKLNPE